MKKTQPANAEKTTKKSSESFTTSEKRQALQDLKERLLEIEFEQQNGASYYSLDELDIALKKIIK